MEIEHVPACEWKTWVDRNGGMVLDVREPDEWKMGTLPGAVRIRLGELPDSLSALDASKPTLVVCRSGGRSLQAALYLTMSGFKWAANMTGGMKALGLQP